MPSKGLRWTFYILLMFGAVGFGFHVTFFQDPESYVPVDQTPRLVEGGVAPAGEEISGSGEQERAPD